MSLIAQMNSMLPAIETELRKQISFLDRPPLHPFFEMLADHMGWDLENKRYNSTGKRIRPLILLLVTSSCSGKWLHAVPAAAAVELIHNFSLVHDDIQDNSPLRHGRPTSWRKFGIPMAINVGDALFAIANQALLDLSDGISAELVIKVGKILQKTCIDLTCGQFLDMAYEQRSDMTLEDYWPMIEGKTAALISACAHIGAILGNAEESVAEEYRLFGTNLGLAFQIQDDIIGIWGEEALTGKSASSDLIEGKNSLPILFGIRQQGEFSRRWSASGLGPDEVREAAQMLRDEGAYDFSRQEAIRLFAQAMAALRLADPPMESSADLQELANKLLVRES